MFGQDEKYINIANDIKVLHSDSKKVEVELVNQDVNKPFTILLMGVDTLSSSYNADTLLLVTFNPDTLGATMLSIPRDTYTTIACTGGKHKINASGWYGDGCVVKTVAKYLDIDIDYYAKINFLGIVDLVDNLGGIEVDVPYALCEQNSKRQFGKNMIYVEEDFATVISRLNIVAE
jgi:LCP family protein required for cell wall assembly